MIHTLPYMYIYTHLIQCTHISYTFYFIVKYIYVEFGPINTLEFLFGINQTSFITVSGIRHHQLRCSITSIE